MALLNGVDSSTQELLDAQTHIWNHSLNFINLMSLRCAIQLGIPDTIHKHGKPMTLSELADALAIKEAKSDGLYRLMRILIHSNFFDISKDEEGYCLTRASRLLLSDEPKNMMPMALFLTDPIMTASFHHMSEWFRNEDSTSFVTTHGRTIWEHAGVDQRFNKLVNEAMASDSGILNSILVKECRQVFEGLKSLVDVGGGTGETAKGIIGAFPELRCVVLDLPHVVDGLKGSHNLSFVGGDMFESIPHADSVFLKWTLHIINDEDCVKVLKSCKEAIKGSNKNGGKVIIVDLVLEDRKDDRTATETQLFSDIQVVVQVAGKERTEKEWANIFYEASFGNYKITRALGLSSVIEVFP